MHPQNKKLNVVEKDRSISSNQIIKQTNEQNVIKLDKNIKIVDYKNVYKPSYISRGWNGKKTKLFMAKIKSSKYRP